MNEMEPVPPRNQKMKKRYSDLKKIWYLATRCVVCKKQAKRVSAFYFGFGGWAPVTVCGPACAARVERDPDKYGVPSDMR